MHEDLAPPHGPRWVAIAGGSFQAGSDEFYHDEKPRHVAEVDGFLIGATPVTNRQFQTFVDDTGYVTVAERTLSGIEFPHLADHERAPGSLVFTPTSGPVDLNDWQQWWRWVPGAQWRRPQGRRVEENALASHPVVHVAYADALAYAEWAGGRLPTEAELEYAACGGSEPAPYAWGETRDPGGKLMANTWRGSFPFRNEGANGWIGTSPVGSFPANAYGLYDCIGNVWEWTSDPYDAPRSASACNCGGDTARQSSAPQDPALTPAEQVVRRVLKGGSHLCAPEYCLRYRPAARSPQAEDSATTHIGFRVARNA